MKIIGSFITSQMQLPTKHISLIKLRFEQNFFIFKGFSAAPKRSPVEISKIFVLINPLLAGWLRRNFSPALHYDSLGAAGTISQLYTLATHSHPLYIYTRRRSENAPSLHPRRVGSKPHHDLDSTRLSTNCGNRRRLLLYELAIYRFKRRASYFHSPHIFADAFGVLLCLLIRGRLRLCYWFPVVIVFYFLLLLFRDASDCAVRIPILFHYRESRRRVGMLTVMS